MTATTTVTTAATSDNVRSSTNYVSTVPTYLNILHIVQAMEPDQRRVAQAASRATQASCTASPSTSCATVRGTASTAPMR